MCQTTSLKNLETIGDSQVIVNAWRRGSTLKLLLNSKLWSIRELAKFFNNISIKHIYREGNNEADRLANLGLEDTKIYEFNKINK